MTDAEQDLEMVKKASEKLGEHFDTVLILTTRYDPATADGTVNINYGCGNWFARYGQVREYLIKCDERTRCQVREEEA
jgi:hypothetical protein